MSDGRENSPAILHVATGGSPPADLERWLASAPFAIDTMADVYRGLARALAPSDRDLQAVIVGVDNLTSTEFEFFPILARHQPSVLICIYGSESQRVEVKSLIRPERCADLSRDGLDALRRLAITSRIESRSVQQPLTVGAEKMRRTAKVVPAGEFPATPRMESVPQNPIASVRPTNPASVEHTTPAPSVSESYEIHRVASPAIPETNHVEQSHSAIEPVANGKKTVTAETLSIASPVEQEGVVDLRDDEEPEYFSGNTESESTSPARVPWRTYTDAPPRLPPQRVAPRSESPPSAASTAPSAPQLPARQQPAISTHAAPTPRPIEPGRTPPPQRQSITDDRYAPLLTPEELQALMADDEEVESLTIDESDALLSDEE